MAIPEAAHVSRKRRVLKSCQRGILTVTQSKAVLADTHSALTTSRTALLRPGRHLRLRS